MAASSPYFMFHPADYLADTQHLTTEEHGAYLLLLMNYWQTGKALNNTSDRLAVVVRLSSERWQSVQTTIAEFFDVDVENDLWTHGRMEHDLMMVRAKSIQASYAGRLGGLAPKKSRTTHKADAKQTLSESEAMNEWMNEQTNEQINESLVSLETQKAEELANYLADKISQNGSKRPKVSKEWISEMDKIMRLDGRSYEQIKLAIDWSQSDDFWCANILSPKKLRDKYDQMRLKASQQTKSKQPKGLAAVMAIRAEEEAKELQNALN